MKALFFLPLFSAFAVTACGKGADTASLQLACTQTVNAYAFARDAIDPDAYGALFTADIEFTFAGETMRGRQAVMDNLQTRGPAFVTRHYITSVMITPISAVSATGSNNAIVYSPANEAGGPPQPLSPDDVFALVRYDDEYRMEDGVCRISKRMVNIEYLRMEETSQTG